MSMFAQRFDPGIVEVVEAQESSEELRESGESGEKSGGKLGRKRKLEVGSDSDSSDSSESDSSESDSSESDSSDSDSESDNDDKDSDKDSDSDSDNDSDSASDSDSDSASSSDSTTSKTNDSEIEDKMDVDNEPQETKESKDYTQKHSTIFTKFNSVPTDSGKAQGENGEDGENGETEQGKDLGPIPQPELPRDRKLHNRNSNNLNWLATPIHSSPEATRPFSEFQISSSLQNNLNQLGFKHAFSVQISVLDILLEDISKQRLNPDFPGDLLVNASTGSGKTLAYTIPIIESLNGRIVPQLRAIILVPTKPLVSQVKQTFDQLSKGTQLYTMSFKHDISINEEAGKFSNNTPDIVVCTPGRLVEHINNGTISLKYLRYLVIDEADRLLNQSFQNWCNIVMSKLETDQPRANLQRSFSVQVQKLIFSATLTTNAGKLSLLKFHKPRLIVINTTKALVNEMFSVPRLLKEYVIKYGTARNSIKPLILAKFLVVTNKLANVLVFTKSNESSIRLAKLLGLLLGKLNLNINVQYLNSTNNSAMSRNKILKQFSNGEIHILVVTDLMARGVDLLSITDVVNYDIPNSSRDYIHRAGRTARANNVGNVYNLVFGKGETKWFNKIMKEISRHSEIEEIEGGLVEKVDEEVYRGALAEIAAMGQQ